MMFLCRSLVKLLRNLLITNSPPILHAHSTNHSSSPSHGQLITPHPQIIPRPSRFQCLLARSWLSQGSHAQPLEATLPVSGTYPHGSPAHVVGDPPRSIAARYYNSATLNIVLLVSLSRVLSHTLCSLSLSHTLVG